MTVSTIHQRLRDNLGLAASESSLRRWIKANLAEEATRNAVVVLRDTPPPGEEAQVDYGLLGRWFDPATERWRRVWGFIMVLAFSRLMFVRPVLKMDQRSWVEAHVLAFEFFGGVPLRIVPDNLKTGVITPDLYDPLINRAFAELATHYGTLIDPARALKPRDKARVERPVPYARDSFFAGRAAEFASVVPHADRRRALVPPRGQRPALPSARTAWHPSTCSWPKKHTPSWPLPRTRLRAGVLDHGQGPPRHPRQGGQGSLLDPLALYRQGSSTPKRPPAPSSSSSTAC